MSRLLAIVACVVATLCVANAALLKEDEYQFLFSQWIAQHSKKYTHDTFFYRYTVWKKNMDMILSHNAKKASWTMAMNDMGDMTHDEYKATKLGYKRIKRDYARSKLAPKVPHSHRAPANATGASVDWRAKGVVTPIKNQQQCGSCWAFSAVGALEGAHAIATGNLLSFAEQQLVDCSQAQGNAGCEGGLMDQAFEYIIANGGICQEAEYTYTAQDGTCQTPASTSMCPVDQKPQTEKLLSAFVDVPTMSEMTGLVAAANIGPVSIAIEADQSGFQYYSSGVYDDPTCGTQLDHGVLIVGYGQDPSIGTEPYWIVKNSWGATWGSNGYIYMVQGKDQCGLAMEPSYPTV